MLEAVDKLAEKEESPPLTILAAALYYERRSNQDFDGAQLALQFFGGGEDDDRSFCMWTREQCLAYKVHLGLSDRDYSLERSAQMRFSAGSRPFLVEVRQLGRAFQEQFLSVSERAGSKP